MTIEEAAEIVRQKWASNDGCRSCGWHPALYEIEPLEQAIDRHDIERGYFTWPCSGDDGTEIHRGIRVWLTDSAADNTG